MSNPKWLNELMSTIDSVVYGNVTIEPLELERNHKKTTKLAISTLETLTYSSSIDAMDQLTKVLVAFTDGQPDDDLDIHIEKRNGTIKLIGYKTKTVINYQRKPENGHR